MPTDSILIFFVCDKGMNFREKRLIRVQLDPEQQTYNEKDFYINDSGSSPVSEQYKNFVNMCNILLVLFDYEYLYDTLCMQHKPETTILYNIYFKDKHYNKITHDTLFNNFCYLRTINQNNTHGKELTIKLKLQINRSFIVAGIEVLNSIHTVVQSDYETILKVRGGHNVFYENLIIQINELRLKAQIKLEALYNKKYLKYKNKYLQLKMLLNH